MISKHKAIPFCNRVNGSFSEETCCDSSPDTTDTMAAKSIQGIIDLQLLFQKEHSKVTDRAYQDPNDKGCPYRYETSSRCNGYQSDNKTCGCTNQCRFSLADHLDQHPGQQCAGRRNAAGHKGMCRKAVCLQRTSCIKTEPSEPQHSCSEKYKWDIVCAIGCFCIASSLSKINGKNQCTDTRTDMYHISSCKVHRANGCQKSTVSPDHMCHWIIHDQRPDRNKEKQRLKTHSSNHGTSDQCWCDHGKHHLERHKYQMRDRIRIRSRLPAYAIQRKPAKISDDPAMISSKCQRISKQCPHNYGQSHDRPTGHHGIYHIFPADQSSVEKRKPRCHKEHKGRTDQHKTSISCIHNHSSSIPSFISATQKAPGNSISRRLCHVS